MIEIGVPSDLSEQSLREAFDEIGPTFIAWVNSFLLVGMYWVWHRDLFVKVRAVNRDVVWLNLMFLLPVSLAPFAPAVLGEHRDHAIALHLYGTVLITVSIVRIALSWYLSRRPHLRWEPIPARERRLAVALSCIPIGFYVG